MGALTQLRSNLVVAVRVLDADAELLIQHVRQVISERTAMVEAQEGKDVPAVDRVPKVEENAAGAIEHLLAEQADLVQRLRVALLRLHNCEGLLGAKRGTP